MVLASYSGRDVWPTIAVSLPGYILAGLTPESLAAMLVRQASCLDVLAVKTRLTHRLSDNLAVLVSVSESNQPPTDRKQDPLITASTLHQHGVGRTTHSRHTCTALGPYSLCCKSALIPFVVQYMIRTMWTPSATSFGLRLF